MQRTKVTTMKIVLDAGHFSGYNQSAVFKAYREGDMTWKLYKLLRTALESKGYTVQGTRGNPAKEIEVYQRGMASAGADLFISLHSNACGTEGVKRVVVIPPYKDQNDTYKLANTLGKTVSDVMGIGDPYQIYTRTYTDAAGKTRDYYGVIRGSVDAGCKRSLIIEHGFHTNLMCAKWLYQETNLAKLAVAEAQVIADMLPVKANAEDSTKKAWKIGDIYTMKESDVYSNGVKVSAFTVGKKYTISRVLPGKILLKEINSWVIVDE